MHTLQKALTESVAVLLVGMVILGALMFVFSQNTDAYTSTPSAVAAR
ncbi:hypothetical protein KKD81_02360 [Patescibacteria group bacterium]|nr:hypothetical protein [Patescibacteria group bacterium]